MVIHSDDAFAPVALLKVDSFHLEDKPPGSFLVVVDPGADIEAAEPSTARSPTQTTAVSDPHWLLCEGSKADLVWCGIRRDGPAPAAPKDAQGFALLARSLLQRVVDWLTDDGLQPGNLLMITVYMHDMGLFPVLNKAYASFFGALPPAR